MKEEICSILKEKNIMRYLIEKCPDNTFDVYGYLDYYKEDLIILYSLFDNETAIKLYTDLHYNKEILDYREKYLIILDANARVCMGLASSIDEYLDRFHLASRLIKLARKQNLNNLYKTVRLSDVPIYYKEEDLTKMVKHYLMRCNGRHSMRLSDVIM